MAPQPLSLADAVETSVLCWLATVDETGAPSVSPKQIFTLVDAETLAIADIASGGSVRNIRNRPAVGVSLLDVFRQKGLKLYGDAQVAPAESALFDAHVAPLAAMAGPRFVIRNLILVTITKTAPIFAPSYWTKPEPSEAEMIAAAQTDYGVRPA